MGNRFHTKLAGKVRRRLEELCDWDGGPKATDLRAEALREAKLDGPDVSIGDRVHAHLRLIPILMIVIGLATAIISSALGS